jgi:hypothetical protein
MSDYDSFDYDPDIPYELDSELDYGQEYNINQEEIDQDIHDNFVDIDTIDHRLEEPNIYDEEYREDVSLQIEDSLDGMLYSTKLESLIMGRVQELDEQIDKLIKECGDEPHEIKDIPIDITNNIINILQDPLLILKMEWTFNPYYKTYYNNSGFMVDFGRTNEEIHESLKPVNSLLTRREPDIGTIIKEQMLIEKTKNDISKINHISYPTKLDKLLNCYLCVFARLPPHHHQNMCLKFTYNTNRYFISKIDSEYRLAGGIDLSDYRSPENSIYTDIIVDFSLMKNLRYLDVFGVHVRGLDKCLSLESLKLSDPRIKNIRSINGYPNLTYLNTTIDHLQRIYDLPKLRILSITETEVENIDELHYIEKLELVRTRITSLNGFNKLKELILYYNNIDNLNELVTLETLSFIIDGIETPLNNFSINNLVNLSYLHLMTFDEIDHVSEEYLDILRNNGSYISVIKKSNYD